MKIRYLGHSCFQIESSDGIKIVTDPYSPMGIKMPKVEADIVTSSHSHYDHNYFEGVSGDFAVVNTAAPIRVKGINIRGLQVFHDDEDGKKRGRNIIFVIEVDGVNVCHMGDLGHKLAKEQINSLGSVDVLLIPVGGFFTIGPEDAADIVKAIAPKIAIPMHFKPDIPQNVRFELPIVDAEAFLSLLNGNKYNSDTLSIDKEHLPASTQVIQLASAAELQ
jgi:L-ascorbate metabolism protein UlaG (beta-lactamase superfamily)